jgi:hypothetical protein
MSEMDHQLTLICRTYLSAARAEVQRIIDELDTMVPETFRRTNIGVAAAIIPIHGAKQHA